MEQEEKIIREMAHRLVDAMEADHAKEVLIKVVDGDDLYDAILGMEEKGTPVSPEKKRGPRKKKFEPLNAVTYPKEGKE